MNIFATFNALSLFKIQYSNIEKDLAEYITNKSTLSIVAICHNRFCYQKLLCDISYNIQSGYINYHLVNNINNHIIIYLYFINIPFEIYVHILPVLANIIVLNTSMYNYWNNLVSYYNIDSVIKNIELVVVNNEREFLNKNKYKYIYSLKSNQIYEIYLITSLRRISNNNMYVKDLIPFLTQVFETLNIAIYNNNIRNFYYKININNKFSITSPINNKLSITSPINNKLDSTILLKVGVIFILVNIFSIFCKHFLI